MQLFAYHLELALKLPLQSQILDDFVILKIDCIDLFLDKKMEKTFSFMDYDAVGFDLDNCLCRYHVSELFKLEYNLLSNFIANQNNHPTESLKKPYEQGEDFILKGLFLDVKKGNVLKIGADGKILQASHGTRKMSTQEIGKTYENFHWSLTDKYVNDPLSTLGGERQVVTDYFDLPVALVFARIVDDLDKLGPQETYDIYPEILACLHNIYDHEQFIINRGGFYTALKKEPEKYIIPSNDNLINWLKSLKNAGKTVFLITGANFDFGTYITNACLGPNWKELFDFVVYHARKPAFWHSNRPYKSTEDKIIPNEDVKFGGEYFEGNYKLFYSLLQKETNLSNPKVVYVGDSIIQDVYAPNYYCDVDTVAIVEELESEGVYGFPQVNCDNAKSIKSTTWGSFFEHNNVDTIWKKFIVQHSVMSTPSVNLLLEHPIEYKYKVSL